MPTNPDQAPSFPSSEQQAQSSAVACDYACPLPPSPSTQPESDSSAGAPQNASGTTSNSATISNSEQPEPDKDILSDLFGMEFIIDDSACEEINTVIVSFKQHFERYQVTSANPTYEFTFRKHRLKSYSLSRNPFPG